jgi:hypothetical protein
MASMGSGKLRNSSTVKSVFVAMVNPAHAGVPAAAIF